MSDTLISVCIPTYNGAKFLGETIDSVLAQTLADFELIIVDDASSDATADILAARCDKRIRYFRHESNQGAAATWNHAVSLARAPLVKLLCHDDTLEPDCLAAQVQPFSDSQTVLVTCWRRVINHRGCALIVRRGLHSGRNISRAQVARAVARSGTNMVGEPSATVFRRSAWEASGGFNGENIFMIDIDMWLRLLCQGTLCIVPETLCTFRVSAGSLSTVMAKRQVDAGRRFFAELRADSSSTVSATDVALGTFRAIIRSWGRQVIYMISRRT